MGGRLTTLTMAASIGVMTGFVGHSAAAQQSVAGSHGARGARWQSDVITLTTDGTLNAIDPEAIESVVQAISAWQAVDATLPTLVVKQGKALPIGYVPDGPNQNTVRYLASGDPMANGALAITVITFDADARKILDADIVLNGEHRFADLARRSGSQGAYDLQNVLTHEMGHFLGLGEDYADDQSTMYAYSLPGETTKRELKLRDVEAIADLYADDPSQAGCGGASISGGSSERQHWFFGLALGLATVLAARRRQRKAAQTLGVAALLVFALTDWPATAVPAAMPALDAFVVTGSHSYWSGGLIVTRLSLRPEACVADCTELGADVLGGSLGNVEQWVGHLRPPAVGETLSGAELEHYQRVLQMR